MRLKWSDEELMLLAAIHENPRDDAPRLAYATWLTAQGNRKGQFIRQQCAEMPWLPSKSKSGFGRRRPKNWDFRREDLWPEPSWSKPLPAPLELVGYSRGLPLAYLPAPPLGGADFSLKDWDRVLRKMSPAARLSIYLPYDDEFVLRISHPLLNRADILSVAGYLIPARAVELLGQSPLLRTLESVHFHRLDTDGETLFSELIRPNVPHGFAGQGYNVGGQIWSEATAQAFMKARGLQWGKQ